MDVKYILQFIASKIFYLVYFAKDIEDWFGYGKNVTVFVIQLLYF